MQHPTITEQIDGFLASKTFERQRHRRGQRRHQRPDRRHGRRAGGHDLSSADFVVQAKQSGQALAAQVRRLVNAGAPMWWWLAPTI